MTTGKNGNRSVATAMALAGRATRACDVCGLQRARLYCAADEAYLCERCDGAVHSANALALRHERVRLSPSGAPMKIHRRSSSDHSKKSKNDNGVGNRRAQVLPSRKRSRTSRPHPHLRGSYAHLKVSPGGDDGPPHKIHRSRREALNAKVKPEPGTPPESEEAPDERTHEVPAFITVIPDPHDTDLSPGHNAGFHEGHSTSTHPLAEYFKGKAAQAAQQDLSDDTDQFLVPDGCDPDDYLDSGVDLVCEIDGTISLVGDSGNFISGEIPGMDGFGDMDLCGNRDLSIDGLNFDLALRGSSDAFEGDGGDSSEAGGTSETGDGGGGVESEGGSGAFATFYTGKVKTENFVGYSDQIKKEAEEMLRCSLQGLSEEDLRQVPSLRLNYEDVLSAWSNRGGFWMDGTRSLTVPEDSNSDAAGSMDVGLVPDLGSGGQGGDEGGRVPGMDDGYTGGGGREARVLRYREKRRTRLFSKKIRYEVRKLNAERRPRMKGRFVKRTPTS